MLAHLKAKHREEASKAEEPSVPAAAAAAPETLIDMGCEEDEDTTKVTCDVLCSLSASSYSHGMQEDVMDSPESSIHEAMMVAIPGEKQRKSKSCPKQHQLPMFLSSKCVAMVVRSAFSCVVLRVVEGGF